MSKIMELAVELVDSWPHKYDAAYAALQAEVKRVGAELSHEREGYETAIAYATLVDGLKDELAAAQADAARFRKIRDMEASMVAPDTIAHYIRNMQRLDYTIELDAKCKESKK